MYHQARSQLPIDQRLRLKQRLINLYCKYKSTFFHERQSNVHALTPEESNSLKPLANDHSIVICKFDKGNCVAILNKEDYVKKMLSILGDTTKFSSLKYDDNLTKLEQFQRHLRYFRGEKEKKNKSNKTKKVSKKAKVQESCFTPKEYKRIYPTSAATPTMFGLPKVHKLGVPLKPILACTGSFNHECAKWLSEILSQLREHPANLKDAFHFLEKIKHLSLDGSVMYSFDVVSLFTNIPL